MTSKNALLRAVFENPDDDAPRLAYADRLEQHGDAARAEFIRLNHRARSCSSLHDNGS
jgi:uncharacterized protein (TIGR02996 family)